MNAKVRYHECPGWLDGMIIGFIRLYSAHHIVAIFWVSLSRAIPLINSKHSWEPWLVLSDGMWWANWAKDEPMSNGLGVWALASNPSYRDFLFILAGLIFSWSKFEVDFEEATDFRWISMAHEIISMVISCWMCVHHLFRMYPEGCIVWEPTWINNDIR